MVVIWRKFWKLYKRNPGEFWIKFEKYKKFLAQDVHWKKDMSKEVRGYLTLKINITFVITNEMLNQDYLLQRVKVLPHYAARHTAAQCGKAAWQKLISLDSKNDVHAYVSTLQVTFFRWFFSVYKKCVLHEELSNRFSRNWTRVHSKNVKKSTANHCSRFMFYKTK